MFSSLVFSSDLKPYKQRVLEQCDKLYNEWGEEVRARIIASLSDLVAGDMRYHVDSVECTNSFFALEQNPEQEWERPRKRIYT